MHAKSLQSSPTLCNPMDYSPPGSSVHGTHVSCVSCVTGRLFTVEPPGVAVGKCLLSRKCNIHLILTAHLATVGDLAVSPSHLFCYQPFCKPPLKAHPCFPWGKAYLFSLHLSLTEQRNLMAILPADAGRLILSTPFSSQSSDSLSLSCNLELVPHLIALSGLLAPVQGLFWVKSEQLRML